MIVVPDDRLDRLEAHLHDVDVRLAYLTLRVDTLQEELIALQPSATPVLPDPAAAAMPPLPGSPAPGPGLAAAPAMVADQHLAPPDAAQPHNVSRLDRVLDPRITSHFSAKGDTAFTARQPRRTRSSGSWQDLERAISERGLALAGGLALLIGAILFFSLAVTRGWIGPEARVALGLIAGVALIVLGDRLLPTRNRVVGTVLVAVGIGVWQLALVAGTRLYEVIPLGAALPGMVAAAAVATALAIRANAQVIALYGLGTALAAPLLFGIPDAQIPIAYVMVMVAATAAVALARSWAAPPWLAFVLSMWQFAAWAFPSSGPNPRTAAFWLAGLAALHGLAALGMTLRVPPRFRPSGPLLLVASGFVYIGLVLALYWRGAAPWLVGGVLACVLLGISCQRAATFPALGAPQAFTRTAFALAILQATITVPLLVDGVAVDWLWAVEALILLWLATHFRERVALVGAAIVFGTAALDALGRARGGESATMPGLPFVSPDLLTLLIFLAVLGVAGLIRHATTDRRVLLSIALLLVTVALPLHVSGVALVAGWAMIALLTIAGDRLLPGVTDAQATPIARAVDLAILPGIAVIPAALALDRAITFEMPLYVSLRLASAPHSGQPVAATVALVAAAVVVATVSPHARVRQISLVVGIGVLAWYAAFALPTALMVMAWAALAVLAERIRQRLPDRGPLLLGLSGVLLAMGAAITLRDLAPLRSLAIASTPPVIATGDALAALGALAAAILVLAWGLRDHQAGKWLACLAGTMLLYGVSLSVVAAFQQNVTPENIADLHRQAHMALSVTWAVIGGLVLGAGVVRAQPFLRWYGLGLLGLATAKVFLYDLNSLDTIYRVLSFLVLGVVLLACATIYRRLDRSPGAPPA